MNGIQRPGWGDKIFDRCVALLIIAASRTGMTYKQVNVILFCIAWPAMTFGLAAALVLLALAH